MKLFRVLALLFIMFFIQFFILGAGWQNDVAKTMFESHQAGEMVKNPTANKPELTVDEAYQIQAALVELLAQRDLGLIGFKAGLTGKAAQEKFGVQEPAFGVLTKAMLLQPGAEIKAADYRRLFIETEIALFLKSDITQALENPEAALDNVMTVAPAIELPDIRSADLKTMKGVDIIADNVGAALVIVGPRIKMANLAEVDKIKVTLSKDGEVINEGAATDALGGQYKALQWSAGAVTKQGGRMYKDQMVITGALGKMMPAKPGNYKADFGELGVIEFTIK